MKNAKILGIIVMVGIIGFTMTACPGDDDEGVVTTTFSLGDELVFVDEQVFYEEWDYEVYSVSLKSITEDLEIKAISIYEGDYYDEVDIGGSGSVTTGMLTFTIGEPDSLELLFDDGPFTVSDPTVKGVFLDFFATDDHAEIHRKNTIISLTETGYSYSDERGFFIYADKDVNISAPKYTNSDNYQKDGVNYIDTYTENAVSINLKKGWNAVYIKDILTSSYNDTTNTFTYTTISSISAGNPDSLNWIYEGPSPFGSNYSILPSGEAGEVGEAAPRSSSFKTARSIFGNR